MKKVLLLLCMAVLPSCSVIQSTPWAWLDQPEDMRWVSVRIVAHDHEISYSIPDRLGKWGNRVRTYPELENGVDSVFLESPPRRGVNIFETPAIYRWDTYWTGLLGGNKHLYDFEFLVRHTYVDDDVDLFQMTPEELIDWQVQKDTEVLRSIGQDGDERARTFLEDLVRETRTNAKSQVFAYKISPMSVDGTVFYMTPISPKELLIFQFWVNPLRYGSNEDLEWNQRRWEIVQQIVDSIEVTPLPPNF